MADFIPAAEGRFDMFANTFVSVVKQNPTKYDVKVESLAQLEALLAEWDATYTEAQAKRDAAQAATIEKDEKREQLENQIREVSRLIQASPDVTNDARKEAGLPVHSTSRTPIGPPTTYPIGFVESKSPSQLMLRIADSNTPNRRALPAGATAAQVYMYIGATMPIDNNQFQFVGLASRSTMTIDLTQYDSASNAFFRLRWVNRKGETGPWSEIITVSTFV